MTCAALQYTVLGNAKLKDKIKTKLLLHILFILKLVLLLKIYCQLIDNLHANQY